MFALAANVQPTRGVHVLLVDSDLASLTATARMLELLSYRVTVTQTGRAALSILEDRRNGINLVITDIGLHDGNGLMVLGEAVRRHIITVSNMNMNVFVIKMALHSGASLFIHKPLNSIVARDLWQFVERARISYKPPIRIPQAAEVRNLRYDSEDDSDSSDESERNPKKKKRVQRTSTPWTDELHAKFVDAVVHLGERNCYPKEILERMNVSDLTRMQVASHLQKCRDGMWHGPEDNRPFIRETCDLGKHSGSRKFGAIPLSVKLQLATSSGSRVVAPELRLGFMDAPSCSKAGSDAPSTSSSGGSSVEKKFYEIMAKLGRDNGSLKIRSPKKEPASP